MGFLTQVGTGVIAGALTGYVAKKVGRWILIFISILVLPLFAALSYFNIITFDLEQLKQLAMNIPGKIPLAWLSTNWPFLTPFAACFIVGFKRG
jgi:uncharacterized membrane protein (Fun14 family)